LIEEDDVVSIKDVFTIDDLSVVLTESITCNTPLSMSVQSSMPPFDLNDLSEQLQYLIKPHRVSFLWSLRLLPRLHLLQMHPFLLTQSLHINFFYNMTHDKVKTHLHQPGRVPPLFAPAILPTPPTGRPTGQLRRSNVPWVFASFETTNTYSTSKS
jgi:hypothetical protein